MNSLKSILALVTLLLGGTGLVSCGNSDVHTSTPSSTLGTDSAATKVGGTMNAPAVGTDTARTGTLNTGR